MRRAALSMPSLALWLALFSIIGCGPLPEQEQEDPYDTIIKNSRAFTDAIREVRYLSAATSRGREDGYQLIRGMLAIYKPGGSAKNLSALQAFWNDTKDFEAIEGTAQKTIITEPGPPSIHLAKIAHMLYLARYGGLAWSPADYGIDTLNYLTWENGITILNFDSNPPAIPGLSVRYQAWTPLAIEFNSRSSMLRALFMSWNFAKTFVVQGRPMDNAIENIVAWTKRSMAPEGAFIKTFGTFGESRFENALDLRLCMKGENVSQVLSPLLLTLGIPHIAFIPINEEGYLTSHYLIYLPLQNRFIDSTYLCEYPGAPANAHLVPANAIKDGQSPFPYLLRFLGNPTGLLASAQLHLTGTIPGPYWLSMNAPQTIATPLIVAAFKREFPEHDIFVDDQSRVQGFSPAPLVPTDVLLGR